MLPAKSPPLDSDLSLAVNRVPTGNPPRRAVELAARSNLKKAADLRGRNLSGALNVDLHECFATRWTAPLRHRPAVAAPAPETHLPSPELRTPQMIHPIERHLDGKVSELPSRLDASHWAKLASSFRALAASSVSNTNSSSGSDRTWLSEAPPPASPGLTAGNSFFSSAVVALIPSSRLHFKTSQQRRRPTPDDQEGSGAG